MSNVVKQLNQIQADAYVMFLKLHNFHWNVKGMEFHAIHEYTESAYNQMSELFDEMAERALQLGKKALVLNADLMQKAKIKEVKAGSFDAKTVLNALEKDYEYFIKAFKALSKEADKNADSTTVAMADENIAKLEKEVWILRSTLGK